MTSFYKRRYLFIFLVTTAIFALGLLLGMVLNEKKVGLIESSNQDHTLNSLSLQLQFLYLSTLQETNESCPVMAAALDHSWDALTQTYQDFAKYKDSSDTSKAHVQVLERTNMLNDIRYWLLLNRAKQFCTLNPSVSVLFFFSDEDCPACEDQSTVLEYFKRLFGERFLLFHLNTDIREPLAEMLRSQYGITTTPAIILDGEVLQGFQSRNEIFPLICAKFSLPQPECEG